MAERQHQRVDYTLRVRYRSASSLLVAYTVNLSRGGVFLATNDLAPIGQAISLELTVPGSDEPIVVSGTVSWHREAPDDDGPRGIGVKFDAIVDKLSDLVDKLVANFQGVNVVVLTSDVEDRRAIARMLKIIIASVEVISATDGHVAEAVMSDDIDLVIVDMDDDEAAGLQTLVLARARDSAIPTIALASTEQLRQSAERGGAGAIIDNPPPHKALKSAVIRLIGNPARVARPSTSP